MMWSGAPDLRDGLAGADLRRGRRCLPEAVLAAGPARFGARPGLFRPGRGSGCGVM